MPIVLLCPSCKVRLTLEDESGGTSFPCPRCDKEITVPVVVAPARGTRGREADRRAPADAPDPGDRDETRGKGMPRWYVIRGDQQRGPFTSKQLKDLARRGLVFPTDLVNVRPHDEDTARRADCIEGLFPLPLGPTPPEPADVVFESDAGDEDEPPARGAAAHLKVSCPKCHKAHKVSASPSGHSKICDFCETRFLVAPVPPGRPAPETREAHAPRTLRTASAPRLAPIPIDDDTDYEPTHVRRRRRIQRATKLWRAATLPALVIALVCYFLPWVKYNILLPGIGFREPTIEFASQSGLEASFALVTLHPALEVAAKLETNRQEARWAREGKSPLEEWMKRSRPYLATWLAIGPLCLLTACVWVMVSQPAYGSYITVLALSAVSGLIVAIQFGVYGPPALAAFYEQLGKIDVAAAIAVALLIDFKFTAVFTVYCLLHAYVIVFQIGAIYFDRASLD